jgi:hypothetical protein
MPALRMTTPSGLIAARSSGWFEGDVDALATS